MLNHYTLGFTLQRIGHSLRQGGHNDIQLQRFEEALHDSSSGLTYIALCGIRKQSVEDVERLFSEDLIKWMDGKDTLARLIILYNLEL